MDELDRKIIGLLQVDGRASNAKIAREVGVSEGTVRRRLRRLIQDDVVKVIAVPNLEKLGYATTALIGLQTGPGKSDAVAEAIAQLDWQVVQSRAQAVLALDPDNPDAINYLGSPGPGVGRDGTGAASGQAHRTAAGD